MRRHAKAHRDSDATARIFRRSGTLCRLRMMAQVADVAGGCDGGCERANSRTRTRGAFLLPLWENFMDGSFEKLSVIRVLGNGPFPSVSLFVYFL
jgi:hypothetical protein